MGDWNENDSPAGAEAFTIVSAVWFLVTNPDADNPADVFRSFYRTRTKKRVGGDVSFVVALTDQDLADRFNAEELDGKAIPIRYPLRRPFAAVLRQLRMMGDTHVGFDPGTIYAVVEEIPTVLQLLAKR